MDINAHGIPNGKPKEFYEELSAGPLKGYPQFGRESRDTCYFLGMFLRLQRALDFLAAQPQWNGRVLCVIGHSQGGGQALAAAGLDPRVTFIGAGVPAICDHTGRAIGRINGWPKLVPDKDGKPDPTVLQVARYFDGMNFATRSKAEAILSVGFIDTVCPPTSVYAAYNNLPGKKQMVVKPLMKHAATADIIEAFNKAMWAHIKAHP
jgi:cephalosporin-C deacetylase-like acetyl esterase